MAEKGVLLAETNAEVELVSFLYCEGPMNYSNQALMLALLFVRTFAASVGLDYRSGQWQGSDLAWISKGPGGWENNL